MSHKQQDAVFHCLLCGNSTALLHYPHVRGDTSGTLQVVDCTACNHRQLSQPVYDLALYEKNLQVYTSIADCGTPHKQYVEDTWLQAKRRVKRVLEDKLLLSNSQQEQSCLDIGGGYGFFPYLLSQAVPSVHTVVLEPSAKRIEIGQQLLEEHDTAPVLTQYITGSLNASFVEQHQQTYDLVTLWHVAEHVPNPIQLVADAWKLVKKGGWLSLEVPNANDELLSRSPAFAKYSYMLEHLSYFTPDLLNKLIQLGTGCQPNALYGYQRYGIFNYMHWIHANAPLGADPDFFSGEDRWWLEENWRKHRTASLTTDALVVNVQKPKCV